MSQIIYDVFTSDQSLSKALLFSMLNKSVCGLDSLINRFKNYRDIQLMCDCSSKKNALEKHLEKTEALNNFLDSLPLSSDIKNNRGFLISCLHKAQSIFGYLPQEVQLLIAEKLRLNLSDVYGVISFYSFFTTQPPGKYKINVCMGTACFVKGADKIFTEFEKQIGIKDGETSKDLRFSLSSIRCVGACSLAPVVTVNDKVYAKMTPKKVSEIIKECE